MFQKRKRRQTGIAMQGKKNGVGYLKEPKECTGEGCEEKSNRSSINWNRSYRNRVIKRNKRNRVKK